MAELQRSLIHTLKTYISLNITHYIICIAVGFLGLANTAQAKPRTCRLVYPERPQDAPKSAYLFDGIKSQSTMLPSMNFSEVIEFPEGELTIAMTTAEITDPNLVSPKSPQLNIPEEITDFYLIISSDPINEELPIKMELIDASVDKLKTGETLWWNGTQDRILANLGNADLKLEPMSRMISKDPAPESGYYNASFSFQVEGKGDAKPITEQIWWHDANSKHLGLVVNSGGKLPKIFFFRDFRVPKE
jgi:hypothetical protein